MSIIEFRRNGDHTINCLITEEEVRQMGFTIEEIISDSAKTQEFMNEIFDMAQEQFHVKFDLGIRTVRVEFRSDRTLSLTFSEHSAKDMSENIRGFLFGLLKSIPPENLKKLQEAIREESAPEGENLVVTLRFTDLEGAIRFAKSVGSALPCESTLIRQGECLYLTLDVREEEEGKMRALSLAADEYDLFVQVGISRLAYLKEHGTVLLRKYALSQLQSL